MITNKPPTLPAGMRDIGPTMFLKREYLINVLTQVFRKYGFAPLATPAMEQLPTLTGKYGPEGDQLLFKVLNSGDFLKEVSQEELNSGSEALTKKIAKKGLRYDLTIPLARYVAQHQHEITFPFKRSQVQPVWRADKPQKGRYREFYQCDVDVVGSESLFCEAELLVMAYEIMTTLGFEAFTIHLNHRLLLKSLAASIGEEGKEGIISQALDKLDKIGKSGVLNLLAQHGLSPKALQGLDWVFDPPVEVSAALSRLHTHLGSSEQGAKGIAALSTLLDYIGHFHLPSQVVTLSPSLARGLTYYTGAIFEVTVTGAKVGSVAGGGRYDGLTHLFGLPNISGVGISFGLDRLYDLMEERQLFPAHLLATTPLLIAPIDESTTPIAISCLKELRAQGIAAELYPAGEARLSRVFSYADKKHIPWVAVIGATELETQTVSLKNMHTGQQENVEIEALLRHIRPPSTP